MNINDTCEFDYIVEDKDLASLLPLKDGDAFPTVLATYRMISLMEIAASRLMIPLLKEGELSVGVNVNVIHSAPTLEGATIKVKATFIHMEGKLFAFDVEIFDKTGSAGKGTHTRAIINNEKLLEVAKKKGL
ncbi:thioesterase family protein [Aliarcobacter lanthieri]|uniref:thioesterase family protein n=1 Tax=Aliarcobacter lanthieri TaxID=1355374 RepID=UPI0004B3BF7C|nr:hotdog domain-containing protein [Aliarcobacter lanthieri]